VPSFYKKSGIGIIDESIGGGDMDEVPNGVEVISEADRARFLAEAKTSGDDRRSEVATALADNKNQLTSIAAIAGYRVAQQLVRDGWTKAGIAEVIIGIDPELGGQILEVREDTPEAMITCIGGSLGVLTNGESRDIYQVLPPEKQTAYKGKELTEGKEAVIKRQAMLLGLSRAMIERQNLPLSVLALEFAKIDFGLAEPAWFTGGLSKLVESVDLSDAGSRALVIRAAKALGKVENISSAPILGLLSKAKAAEIEEAQAVISQQNINEADKQNAQLSEFWKRAADHSRLVGKGVASRLANEEYLSVMSALNNEGQLNGQSQTQLLINQYGNRIMDGIIESMDTSYGVQGYLDCLRNLVEAENFNLLLGLLETYPDYDFDQVRGSEDLTDQRRREQNAHFLRLEIQAQAEGALEQINGSQQIDQETKKKLQVKVREITETVMMAEHMPREMEQSIAAGAETVETTAKQMLRQSVDKESKNKIMAELVRLKAENDDMKQKLTELTDIGKGKIEDWIVIVEDKKTNTLAFKMSEVELAELKKLDGGELSSSERSKLEVKKTLVTKLQEYLTKLNNPDNFVDIKGIFGFGNKVKIKDTCFEELLIQDNTGEITSGNALRDYATTLDNLVVVAKQSEINAATAEALLLKVNQSWEEGKKYFDYQVNGMATDVLELFRVRLLENNFIAEA
jgi:hypothetical protein